MCNIFRIYKYITIDMVYKFIVSKAILVPRVSPPRATFVRPWIKPAVVSKVHTVLLSWDALAPVIVFTEKYIITKKRGICVDKIFALYSSGRENLATTHQERKKYRSTGLLLPENVLISQKIFPQERKKKDNCNDLNKWRNSEEKC